MSQQGDRVPADFLTRDYDGIRSLLLEQLRRADIRWTTRSGADAGVMLVELVAYHLDHLSYAGDRVAGEAFLSTARRPESVRRHAALGDYRWDRGQATHALQHFRLDYGQRLTLPAGTQVAGRLGEGETFEQRALFETREAVELDHRRNVFRLERSAAAGGRTLALMTSEGEVLDLRSIGFKEGMPLIILDRDKGEVAEVAGIQGGWVELATPLGHTYLAGTQDLSAAVFSNLVPLTRGETQGDTLIGRGGALIGEAPLPLFLTGRMEILWGLRLEVESARALWQPSPHLVTIWREALCLGGAAARQLRQITPATLTVDEARALDDTIQQGAGLLRQILREIGLSIPRILQPSSYAPIPNQRISLPGEEPILFRDDRPTLRLLVGEAGRWREWVEVEDLLGSRPDDRHYVLELNQQGYATLVFGDGALGARLPSGAQVYARWEFGDPWGGDLGEGALTELIGARPPELVPDHPTFNPLKSAGARPPEPLARVPGRLQRALQRQVVPVTQGDYVVRAARVPGVAEAAYLGATGERVEIVVRPEADAVPGVLLRDAQAALSADRLAGTGVRVRLPRPLYVSVTAIVDIHPEMWPAEVLLGVRGRLLSFFAEQGGLGLGEGLSRGELLEAIEGVTGVVWSHLPSFRRASAGAPDEETLTPAADQRLRCLDLAGRPELGTLDLWFARRFDLSCVLTYPDPDGILSSGEIEARLRALLSGLEAAPAQRGWEALTPEAIQETIDGDALLNPLPLPSGSVPYRLTVDALLVGDRRVEHAHLEETDVAILLGVEIKRSWTGL